MDASYETPVITDIGDLRELTAAKDKLGPVLPAYSSDRTWGNHNGPHTSLGSSGFSARTTRT